MASLKDKCLAFILDANLRNVMIVHAIVCMFLGFVVILAPHRFFTLAAAATGGNAPTYNHISHELSRLYGVLTLSIGYFVWSTKDIRDARLMRATAQTFCICYSLQSFIMLRAQFTSDNSDNGMNPHKLQQVLDVFHWLVAILFLLIGFLYGYLLLTKKIKAFANALPGGADDDDF